MTQKNTPTPPTVPIPLNLLEDERLLAAAAKKLNIKVEPIDQSTGLNVFSRAGRRFFVWRHIVDLNSYVASAVANNKAILKRLLVREGIRTAPGFTEKNPNRALERVRQGDLSYPLVVKPIDGSGGVAVTVDVRDDATLLRGIEEVFKFNRRTKGKPNSFLVEAFVPGDDYRFVVLDGRVLTVLLRKPAYVIGDGRSSIGRLIDLYNSQPGVEPTLPLNPIVRDLELQRHLSLQNLAEHSVVGRGVRVVLRKNANVSTGGRSFECTDRVHEDYKKLAVRIARLLELRFCAVDLLAPDIRRFEKFAVLEVNTRPGLDVHEKPYRGRAFALTETLLRAMFR
ncbi:MAG: hypothetical protein Q8P33_02255 [bacterium]|nr:hypothetical protein [bacterium]